MVSHSPSTVLITGASSGIGRACAFEFARHGLNLVLTARHRDSLLSLKRRLMQLYPVTITVIPLDLCKRDAALLLQKALARRGILIDILINNAGYGDFTSFLDADWPRQRNMVQLNIIALMQLTYVFGNEMRHRGHGRIVNLSSVAAFFAGPNMAAYYATKAFVLSFSESVAEELRGSGVTVTAICPSPTATHFARAAHMTGSRMFTFHRPQRASVVAAAVYRSCMKGRTLCYPSGVTKLANIGVRLAPRALTRKVTRWINGEPQK